MATKGPAFERWLCQVLSGWWTGNGARDDVFWRTSGSGARATTRSRKGKGTKGQYGDVCAIDPIGQPLIDLIVFELKNGYSHLSLQDLLDLPPGKKGGNKDENYPDWLAKIEATRKASGAKYWALIVKRGRRQPLIVMEYMLWNLIDPGDRSTLVVDLRTDRTIEVVVALQLADFLAGVNPDQIRSLYDGYRAACRPGNGQADRQLPIVPIESDGEGD